MSSREIVVAYYNNKNFVTLLDLLSNSFFVY